MRVKCLAQEHNTMSLARARTQSTCTHSGVERTNHEATVPPTQQSNPMMKRCVPLMTCLYQLTRKEQEDSLELSTIWASSSQIWQLSTLTLTPKDIEFQWSHEQDKALQEIKNMLTKDGGPVLRFVDVQKPTTISCDASPTGLGGVLLQDERPVACSSRSLTDEESRYMYMHVQIEKELLAVQFSLECFRVLPFSQITNHFRLLLKRHWHQLN